MTAVAPPTRAAGLVRLEAFAPRMGRAYAAHRNADLGPGANVHVSGLSPWIRRRLVTEEEAVRAALEAHGPRGADLFLRRLTDADPASNTLSWRWVAGLQTPGKTYLATAENIARFTEGRFRPKGLATEARPVEGPPAPAARPLPRARSETPNGPHLLLITGEDLTPEQLIGPWEIAGVVSVPGPVAAGRGAVAAAFDDGALADAERRAQARYGRPVGRLEALTAEALVAAAQAAGAVGVVTPCAPVGPTAAALTRARLGVEAAGMGLIEVRRPWDVALWPLATRGFFPFRERAPEALRGLGLGV